MRTTFAVLVVVFALAAPLASACDRPINSEIDALVQVLDDSGQVVATAHARGVGNFADCMPALNTFGMGSVVVWQEGDGIVAFNVTTGRGVIIPPLPPPYRTLLGADGRHAVLWGFEGNGSLIDLATGAQGRLQGPFDMPVPGQPDAGTHYGGGMDFYWVGEGALWKWNAVSNATIRIVTMPNDMPWGSKILTWGGPWVVVAPQAGRLQDVWAVNLTSASVRHVPVGGMSPSGRVIGGVLYMTARDATGDDDYSVMHSFNLETGSIGTTAPANVTYDPGRVRVTGWNGSGGRPELTVLAPPAAGGDAAPAPPTQATRPSPSLPSALTAGAALAAAVAVARRRRGS